MSNCRTKAAPPGIDRRAGVDYARRNTQLRFAPFVLRGERKKGGGGDLTQEILIDLWKKKLTKY